MIAALDWWATALYYWLCVSTVMSACAVLIALGYQQQERRQEERRRRIEERLRGEIERSERRVFGPDFHIPNYELIRDGEGRMIGVVEVPRGT